MTMESATRVLVYGPTEGDRLPMSPFLRAATGAVDLAMDGPEWSRPVGEFVTQNLSLRISASFVSFLGRRYLVLREVCDDYEVSGLASCLVEADAVILHVDAHAGLTEDERRLMFVAARLGVGTVVLAISVTEGQPLDQALFEAVQADIEATARRLEIQAAAVPIFDDAEGGNVVGHSADFEWYAGPTISEYLDAAAHSRANEKPNPVRIVLKGDDQRGVRKRLIGTVMSGTLVTKAQLTSTQSRRTTEVTHIKSSGVGVNDAVRGQDVEIDLDEEIEIGTGEMLVSPESLPHVADQFAATVFWLGKNTPLVPGRIYILRTPVDEVAASVRELKSRINVETGAHEAAKTLKAEEVGVCNISTKRPIAFDAFADIPATGLFFLIDGETGETLAFGTIGYPLRRSTNIRHQPLDLNKQARAALMRQRPMIIWFTGFSGAGKSTIVNGLAVRLHARGRHTYVLDGDNIRQGLNGNLGFTEADRVENIRRVGEVARLMIDAGLIVLVALISPYRADRRMVRELVEDGEFVEVFVDTPLRDCMRRDHKGLYARALKGEIQNFTGIDSRYEPPLNAEMHLKTSGKSPDELIDQVEGWLRKGNYW